jgi:hypothetical protein
VCGQGQADHLPAMRDEGEGSGYKELSMKTTNKIYLIAEMVSVNLSKQGKPLSGKVAENRLTALNLFAENTRIEGASSKPKEYYRD